MNLVLQKTKALNLQIMSEFRKDFEHIPSSKELVAWAEPKFKEFFSTLTKEELVELTTEFNLGLMLEAFRFASLERLRN